MNREYAIVIFYSDEDACYVADIPDLRYCSAFGETPHEALTEAIAARDAWLESARVHVDPLPAVRYRPFNDRQVKEQD